MKRENSKTRNKRRDKRALERAILRTMRATYLGGDAGRLTIEAQAVLYGLEKARRAC